jgi:hypothetical protein
MVRSLHPLIRAELSGDGADRKAGADERVQVGGADAVWVGPGQVMPVTQSNGGSRVTGSSMLAWVSREPGEVFLHRGGGQISVVEVAAVRPGVGVGEEVPLAAPAGDVELGLGEAAQSAPAGVVDGGTVLLELAGELADRGRDWSQDAVLAQSGGEAGDSYTSLARGDPGILEWCRKSN